MNSSACACATGVVELQLGTGNWQALTDATLATVTELHLTPRVDSISLTARTDADCASAPAPCSPRLPGSQRVIADLGACAGRLASSAQPAKHGARPQ